MAPLSVAPPSVSVAHYVGGVEGDQAFAMAGSTIHQQVNYYGSPQPTHSRAHSSPDRLPGTGTELAAEVDTGSVSHSPNGGVPPSPTGGVSHSPTGGVSDLPTGSASDLPVSGSGLMSTASGLMVAAPGSAANGPGGVSDSPGASDSPPASGWMDPNSDFPFLRIIGEEHPFHVSMIQGKSVGRPEPGTFKVVAKLDYSGNKTVKFSPTQEGTCPTLTFQPTYKVMLRNEALFFNGLVDDLPLPIKVMGNETSVLYRAIKELEEMETLSDEIFQFLMEDCFS